MVNIANWIRAAFPMLLVALTIPPGMGQTQTAMDLKYEGRSIHITKISTHPSGKSVVVLHGMCMYGDYYHCITDYLPDDYANFYFIDMANHGRSSGEKGYLPDPNTILNILDFSISEIKKTDQLEHIDLIVGGSMGGIFALSYLLNRDQEANTKYLIFGAPLYVKYDFLMNVKQPRYLYDLLFARNKLVLPVKVLIWELIKDSVKYEQILKDSLIPPFVNFNYPLTIKKMTRNINSNIDKLSKDVLFFYGGQDAISNVKKIVKQNQKLKTVKTIVLPNKPHSIFWTEKDAFVVPIKNWLSEPPKSD
jgi:alpha-beta hydrolase superfamily lysophospholipase